MLLFLIQKVDPFLESSFSFIESYSKSPGGDKAIGGTQTGNAFILEAAMADPFFHRHAVLTQGECV
jgi:hypothetical protein